jgi:hypothetical protein
LRKTSEISIYPNPAIGEINISAENEIDEIRIYSTTGKLMIQKAKIFSNKLKVDTEEFTPGIYLIQVFQKGSSSTYKFIVQ